jgi:DNA-binding NarL/FixJ family response regulator
LAVDDHADFLASAQALLQADGFEVIGEAASGVDAIIAASLLRPAVFLLDIRLPDLDGFAVAQRLAELAERPQVVLVSSRDAAVYGRRLVLAPIRGVLAKSDLTGDALRRLLR